MHRNIRQRLGRRSWHGTSVRELYTMTIVLSSVGRSRTLR